MDCSPAGSSVHEFSRQEYWNGLLFPSPEDLLNPGIEPGSPVLQADSLLSEPPWKSPFHLSYLNYWHMASHSICILFCVAYSDQFPIDWYLSCFHFFFFFFAVTNNASVTILLCLSLCSCVSVFIVYVLEEELLGQRFVYLKMLIVCFYLLILFLLIFLSLLICISSFFKKLSVYLAVSGLRCVMRALCCGLRAPF